MGEELAQEKLWEQRDGGGDGAGKMRDGGRSCEWTYVEEGGEDFCSPRTKLWFGPIQPDCRLQLQSLAPVRVRLAFLLAANYTHAQ